ncbi:MAG: aminodeoxychorismate synthase component I [Thalassotalea sp.]
MLETLQAIGNSRGVDEITITNIDFENLQHPEDLFCYLADKPWAMWLDSCESNHCDAELDIIVWQPIFTLSTVDELTTVKDVLSDKTHLTNDDPLAILDTINNSVFAGTKLPCSTLPFVGGALGYFSYDLGRRFEILPSAAVKDINQPDMAIGIYTHAVIYHRSTKTFQLVAPKNQVDALIATIEQLLLPAVQHSKPSADFALTSTWQANMNKAQYHKKFNAVQNYLLAGDCYQTNLAQRFKASYQGDEFYAYQALRAQNKAPFSAFIRLENSCILSTSPERFLQLSDNKVQSKPIKGTRPRSDDPIIDQQNAQILKKAEKDRAENLMIVDLLRNDLSKVCQPGSVKVPEIFAIESFPAVHHLVSTVEGTLESQYQASDLLRGAFPGGSITGAPKIRAMEIIDELEPQRRSLYCGAIGYISASGNMDTSITIRTLICENNNIYCWAGGGLVADSDADSEYQETLDKVNKILPVLSGL